MGCVLFGMHFSQSKNARLVNFTRKIIDFDTFTKIAMDCGRFGQINCCQRQLAPSPINHPIRSHWPIQNNFRYSSNRRSSCGQIKNISKKLCNKSIKGSGCGAVGRAVASDT